MSNDSFYAQGVGVIKMKAGTMDNKRSFTGKTLELLECMMQAGALTKSAAATALRCGRHEAGNVGKTLWYSGMIDIYRVYSRDTSGNNVQFHLWVAKDCQPPANATEACRLALLGIFFGHAKIEMPGFGWRLLRRPSRPAMAEVRLDGKDGNVIRWAIDAPRMREDPVPEADLLIYPTREDAEQKTPAGKRYTWDLAVIDARPDELRNAVKLKKMPEMKGAVR